MADVVRIQERLARMARREAVRRETPAEILLFTGVRYERLTPASLPRKPGSGLGKTPRERAGRK